MQGVRIFTIITKSHLAYAKALAVKVEQFHPGVGFTIFVVDPEGMGSAANGTPAEIRSAADLFDNKTFRLMTGYYTADELCNACKPWAHAALLYDESTATTLYLDSDIFITGSLSPLLEDLGSKSMLLTPHLISPHSDAAALTQEMAVLNAGIYNGGCVAFNKSAGADSFLIWWKERLRFHCLRGRLGLCYDQSWLDFAPALLPSGSVAVSRRPGVNIGHWNVHERFLRKAGSSLFFAGKDRVMFIHFSGWDWRDPEKPSKYALTEQAKTFGVWKGAGEIYAQLLLQQGIEQSSKLSYTFARSEDGKTISDAMREKYWKYVVARGFSNPSEDIFRNPSLFTAAANNPDSVGLIGKLKRVFII